MNAGWLVAVLLAFAATASGAEELGKERVARQKIASDAAKAFRAEDYATLESMANDLRVTHTRTPAGAWSLDRYYAGVTFTLDSSSHPSEEKWKEAETIAQRWIAAYPKSPVPYIAYSKILSAHGWSLRGGGYADTVTKAGWEFFFRYIAQARTNLEEHKAIASSDPAWYETMLGLAKDQQWELPEFSRLVDDALRHYPDYYPIHFAAVDYLLPKWHGSAEQLELFANMAVQRSHAHEGIYARIYWHASLGQFQSRLFEKSQVRWPAMKAGFDDIVARYPDDWNFNNYGRFACLAGDMATTKQLILRIGDKPEMAVWGDLWQTCSRRVFEGMPHASPALEKELELWLGKPIQEYITKNGPADRVTDLGDGRSEYLYHFGSAASTCFHYWVADASGTIAAFHYNGECDPGH